MLLLQMVMLLTGMFMIAFPGAATRKDARGDKEAVKKSRTMGMWIFFAGLIWVISSKII